MNDDQTRTFLSLEVVQGGLREVCFSAFSFVIFSFCSWFITFSWFSHSQLLQVEHVFCYAGTGSLSVFASSIFLFPLV